MRDTVVVFDLDGTLIDSAPSILASLHSAFALAGVQPTGQLTDALIGPPLPVTVASLLGEADKGKKDQVVAAFKTAYDSHGYRQSRVYEGIRPLLEQLFQHGVALFVATNKRILPTRQIVEFLGWQPYFQEIWALDAVTPALADKKAMLQQVAGELQANPGRTVVYVGDRREDMDAALHAGMQFFWASWGYGQATDFDPAMHLTAPDDLVRALLAGPEPS